MNASTHTPTEEHSSAGTKIIAVAIQKGGVGKTVTSKNLAAALQAAGCRTLLIDMDQQANATRGLGVDPAQLEVTLNDLFANPSLDPHQAVVRVAAGMHLLPGHPSLANTEAGMALQRANPSGEDPTYALRRLLEGLRNDYDYVVIDTPPSLGWMTLNALAAADQLIVPASAGAYSAEGLTKVLEAWQRVREQGINPGLELRGLLITRFKRTNASAEVLNTVAAIAATCGSRVFPQVIPEATAVDEAEQLLLPVVLYDPQHPAAQAYAALAEEVRRG